MGYEDVEWDEIIEGGSLPDEALRNKHLEDNEGRKAGSNSSSCLQEEMRILGNRPVPWTVSQASTAGLGAKRDTDTRVTVHAQSQMALCELFVCSATLHKQTIDNKVLQFFVNSIVFCLLL